MAATPSPPTTPGHPGIDPSPLMTPEPRYSEPHYESPLYTEINIPLPPLPGTPKMATPASPTSPASPRSRHHTHSLHSFSPFHRRRSSSPTASLQDQQPRRHHQQRIELSMKDCSKGTKKRSGTIEAAIVPAVMVLSAELFTPGEAERAGKMEVGKDKLEVIK